MSFPEIITSVLSVISIVLSLWAAHRASQVDADELRLSKRADLHAMLTQIDQVMIGDPQIAAIFKSVGGALPELKDPLTVVKADTYIQMHFNLFELAFAQFKALKKVSRSEAEIADAWDRFVVAFFKDCDRAKTVWNRQREALRLAFRPKNPII
jgi:hypothetical protein